MKKEVGVIKPELQALAAIRDRITFAYFEHSKINSDDGAIIISNEKGITSIPAATISVILLGPGTDITHRAMKLIGEVGVSVIWVGEHGVRYYACGRPLTNHSTLLLKQAKYVSNEKLHISVARKMYQLRFKDEDVSKMTMQQLRGKEGARVKRIYRELSKKWNVEWNGRVYDIDNYEDGSLVNKALSAGNVCLYGLATAVICALGLTPGLGFVHVGHELSFAYDVADLYKAETTMPIAFELASKTPEDIGTETRRMLRDAFKSGKILNRMVHDIKYLLSEEEKTEDYRSTLYLWDNIDGNKEHGIMYGEDD